MILPIVSDKLTSASSTPFSSVEDNKTPSTPPGVCLLRPVWLFALFDADVLAFWNPQKMLTFYHTLGQTFTLKPRPKVAVLIWKRGFFFPPVCPTIHTYPVKTVTENASFPNVSQSGDFCKRHQTIVFVNRGKRRFPNKMMPYIMQRMPWEHAIGISIVFACSCGRAKTIQIYGTCGRLFFENEEIIKTSVFKIIRIRVDEALKWGQRLVHTILYSFSWNWKLPIPEKTNASFLTKVTLTLHSVCDDLISVFLVRQFCLRAFFLLYSNWFPCVKTQSV